MQKNQALRKQVEYYLSDKNLQTDVFFHKAIQDSGDGFIDIKLFLNCNKVKKMGVSAQDLAQAISHSKQLVLSADKAKVRRASTALPPLNKPTKKGRIEAPKKDNKNPYIQFQPVVFSLIIDHQTTHSFKFIQEALIRQHGCGSPYARFHKNQGNFVLSKSLATQETTAKLESEGIKIGEDTIKIQLTKGKQLDQFWEKHGFHYNGIMDRLKKQFDKRERTERRQKQDSRKEFELAGRTFCDSARLKSELKMIQAKTINGQKLTGQNEKLLVELLKHHPRGADKVSELAGIEVDRHPEHPETRCFFIVRKDGTKEDFSTLKCIKALEDGL